MTNTQIMTGTGDNFGFETETFNPFKQALENFDQSKFNIEVGQTHSGKIVDINNKYCIIDISAKSPIYVQLDQFEKSIISNYNLNDKVDVLISKIIDKKDFTIYGSVYNVMINSIYDFLNSAVTNKKVLTGIATEMNHAGYTVEVIVNDQPVTLFMPHLLTDVNKLPDPECILNQEFEFILNSTLKDGQKQYIVNRKAFLQTMIKAESKKLVKGNLYQGYVINVTDFSVFVQFNECLTGMIHKSNLSDVSREMFDSGKITNGMGIEFYVKDIIKGKTFLTQHQKESLWDKISVNDELTGKVSVVKDFGVLVELDFETKGLLYKNTLKDPITKYNKGQQVRVKVNQINKELRQITLTQI